MSVQVVAAVIEGPDRRILIGQRDREDSSPLKWEFPGGAVEPGESLEQALARELREELDVTLLRALPISQLEHRYSDHREPLFITFFAASILESELHPQPFERIAWVLPRELSQYDFLSANLRLVAELATGRIKPGEILASSAQNARPEGQ